MQDKLLQTPDGVRDTYDVECKKKRKVMHELHHILELYSYHAVSYTHLTLPTNSLV